MRSCSVFAPDPPRSYDPHIEIVCDTCGRILERRLVKAGAPHAWDDLAFRCDDCDRGFSNAASPGARRRITRTAEMNVPEQVREGLGLILDRAVNVQNRPMKRWKFCSDRSEDAVTWTVVRALQRRTELSRLLPSELAHLARGEPALLLWGAPAGGPGAEKLADRLAEVSSALGERPNSRTEPDVVVAWPELLLIVEAKLGSRNDLKPHGYGGWSLYTKNPALKETGLYELVRNWRIGDELAGDRAFVLCNLAPEPLDRDVEVLRRLLPLGRRRALVTRRWADVVPADEEWLVVYGRSRRALP